MAETMATELLKVVFKMLADEAFKQIARSQGIHSELKELGRKLTRIQNLLNDASEKEVTEKSVKEWLNSLQHLAYDISDVLDDLATNAMHRELSPESVTSRSKVRKLIPSCCTNFSLTHRLSPKLDRINKELEDLEKQNPGLIVKGENPNSTSRRNQTSLPDRSRIVGREGEVENLLNKLLSNDENSKDNFSVLPIVGMGGVGKTTLARLLYNHTKVKDRFELKVWFCVSDDFDIIKISNTILQSVTRESKEYKDLNQLQIALLEQFKDKRFLLVLDDVWHENYDDWENLVRPFHSCASGSRIIMTTRKDLLLKKIGFHHLVCLKQLSDKDALSLFALHALGVDNFDSLSHTTFKSHGEGIVKKCAGLPLAIKAIGRLLRSRGPCITVEDWDYVLNSEIWDMEDGKKIIPALRLSYHELSADLKQLFVYCSLFPKDYMFDKEELVFLWMAEGFLNPSNATKSSEHLGHEYFEIMVSRSFFQHAPNDGSLFIMHDLMVDLATFVAGEFFLRFDDHTKIEKEALVKHRHMSFIRENYVGYKMFEAFKGAKSLRTFLAASVGVNINGFHLSNKILVELLPELEMLRVLSLSHFKISEVPESIGNLKHLRYLNLSKTAIQEVPESVGNLYNLETLILFGCENLSKLPKSFIKLKKLRHFDIRNTKFLEKLPLGIGELESLHTLSRIIIEEDDGFAINELKQLKNLHGEVSIEGLQKVQSTKHARDANLSLKKFTELRLEWVDVFDGSRRDTLENEVLDELKPHSDTLKKLAIMSYGGTKFSNWVGDPSFHKLVNVSIGGCRKCIFLPLLGHLPSLKELSIAKMNEIKSIGLELTGSVIDGFPSLETLSFEDMSGWEVWSTDNKVVFPRLRKLVINNCPKLIYVSLEALPSLRYLDLKRCYEGVLTSLVQAASSSITYLFIQSIQGLTYEVWRGVIKYLRVVEELSIRFCNEIRYLWESEGEASKDLVNLKKLDVSFCDNLVSLGEKEEENDDDNFGSNILPSLKYLYISSCESMERVCCPNNNNIEDLSLRDCKSLTRVSFPTTTIGGARGGGGQKLKSLRIYRCEKLTEKINNANMPMLEKVTLDDWKSLKSVTQLSTTFIHLASLSIRDCPSIESFSDVQISNLTHLTITGCEWLELPQLSNLTSLIIRLCQRLESLAELPNLTHLEIYSCDRLESLPELPNLTHLEIEFCERLESLPELPNLTHLEIKKCERLESITDLSSLTLLEHLIVEKCKWKCSSFPFGVIWPPSLVRLKIGGLKEKLDLRGNQNFPTSLVYLTLSGERTFSSDLDGVSDFSQLSDFLPSSLTRLEIIGFGNLKSLSTGLQHLTSLQHLQIWNCPQMKHLPKTLLPSLLSLYISCCIELGKRCDGRGSHYWPLISHIPCIEIIYSPFDFKLLRSYFS